ncbi:lysophospholipase D GDPD1 isoform X1 [Rhipicephalus microplus]|uniref:Putative tick transposon n=3 Tax=Rhipicephalus microplus TaxID=6941 RepID=A0A6M2CID0_RHIMP|nr:lysophospholipase D GDPD1-like isoform X1 [Rhipicephalus microplus]
MSSFLPSIFDAATGLLPLSKCRYSGSMPEMFAVTLLSGYIVTSVILFKYPHLLHRRKQLKFPCRHISHRGGSAENLENTISAFRHALKVGTELIELDVQLTKDGKVVVCHDSGLLRCAGVNKNISELNYDELPPLKPSLQVDFCNGAPSPVCEDRKIPLLSDIFTLFPSVPVNIDIKTKNDKLVEKVHELIKEFNREDITVWGSFHHSVATKCYKLNPEVPLYFSARCVVYLLFLTYSGLLPFVPLRQSCLEILLPSVAKRNPSMMEQLKQPKSRFLFRLLDWFVVRKFVINHLRKRGIPTYLWVLNEKEDFEKAFAMGAAGVMTDRPTLLREYLDQNPCIGR